MISERFKQAFRLNEIEGRFDGVLLATVLILAGLGVVMVMSSSVGVTQRLGLNPFHFMYKHLVFLGLGVALAVLISRTELRSIERQGPRLLLVSMLMLVLVLVPHVGAEVNGAQRWLNLGVVRFQVVEAVKLFLIIWLASYLVRHRNQVQDTWWGLIKPAVVAGLMVILLLQQPDFGSALLICAIVGGMVFLGGVRIGNLIAPILIVTPLMAMVAVVQPYRMRRLTSFMNPWADPYNDGYQLVQALIAIGRGEWFGVGIGASIQKLSFLPEAHTDFIFSVLAEELGFVGVMLIISLFALLVGRAFWLGLAAMRQRRPFAGYCAFGVGLWIGLQAVVSIGVNLGLLPTKGLTLPLISSGGSSVLMTCAAIGLLLRVSYEVDRTERQIARIQTNAEPFEPGLSDVVPTLPEGPLSGVKVAASVEGSEVGAKQPSWSGRIEPSFGARP